MNASVSRYLLKLGLLQQTIFSIFIRRDYAANKDAYEKKILQHTESLMRAMQKSAKDCQ